MNSGGIALRLIDFAKVLVGRLPGGLAVVNVVANMLFGRSVALPPPLPLLSGVL